MDKWSRLQHFNENENWGEPTRMDELLLVKLDRFRSKVGFGFTVTCGTQGTHTPKSAHYRGEAVDGVFGKTNKHFLEILFTALREGFHGIGYYPHWRNKGVVVGGWHLDMAPDRIAMWLGILNDKGHQDYYPLDYTHLKKFKII